VKALPYQKTGVRRIEAMQGRGLIAADPGLGKTAMAAWLLKRNPTWLPAIIVCPAAVKYQWEHELLQVAGMRASVLEGTRPSKPGAFDHPPSLVVVNYDILKAWKKWIAALAPNTVVVDEVQYIANERTQRTRAVKTICKDVEHVIGLSGTPLVNRPMELFPGLQILRPDVFNSRWDFGQRFCGAELTPWGWLFKGSNNEQELHDLLTSTCMVRYRKSDVLEDLPNKHREVVVLPMRRPEEYEQAQLNFIDWLRRQDPAKAVSAGRAEQMTKVGYLLRLAARLKLRYAVEWINGFLADSDEKLVVFAVHKKAISALKRRCNSGSVVIDGGTPAKTRRNIIRQFRDDSRTRLLIGNIRAAGTGLDGMQAASNVAFVEMPWHPGASTQAEDRVYRIGTTKDVFCWYLVARNSAEVMLCRLLQRKQGVISSVLDGGPGDNDLDIYTQLVKEMQK